MTMDSDAFNAKELALQRIWPEHVSRLTAFWQAAHGLECDAKLGIETRNSLRIMSDNQDTPIETPRSEPADQADLDFGSFDGPLSFLPTSRTEIYSVFGNPGAAKVDKHWVKKNIVTVRDLPGIPRKWHFRCHRLAEPYMREGLRRAAQVSDYKIERAGGFVFRHIRHDPGRPLSLHSFGIAIDVDPARNSAKKFKRGTAPVPWSKEWRRIWPDGIDEAFVRAMESAGWLWGGVWSRRGMPFAERAKRVSWCDNMHFQLLSR